MPGHAQSAPERPPEHATPPSAAAAGWYADPARRVTLRHWDGTAWTPWVCDLTSVWREHDDAARALTPTDVPALAFVTDEFLPRAHRLGMLSDQQTHALTTLAGRLTDQARGAAGRYAPPPAPAPVPMAAAAVHPPTVDRARPEPAAPTTGPTGVYTGPWAPPRAARTRAGAPVPWARALRTIRSELAVHGLAYLGVLLLLVGVFGLVAFAFGDVTPAMRPVAELAAAGVPFVAARLLVRHGAQVAGRAMETVGGLLLPLMLVTSTVDGVGVPPDLHGTTLVVVLSLGCAVLALAFGRWSLTHHLSGLRYAAAPTVWFGAAMATIAVGRPMPTGQDVAIPSVAQTTAMAIALAVTVAAARLVPATPLGGPTRIVALPGLAVIAVLAPATWQSPGSAAAPVVLAGTALLVAAQLSSQRISAALLDVAGPLWWSVVAATLLDRSTSVAALVAVVGFVALLEVAGRRARPLGALLLAASGLLAGLVVLLIAGPTWTSAVLTACAAWSIWRRTRCYTTPGSALLIGSFAAVLLLAAVVGLRALTDGAAVPLCAASVLVVAGALPTVTRAVSHGPADRFWVDWWRSVLIATAGSGIVVLVSAHGADQWAGVGTVAVCAAAATVGPVDSVVRPWIVTALGTTAWWGACEVLPIPVWVRGVVLGSAALVAVVLARYPADGPPRRGQAGVALSGHLVAIVAVAASGGWVVVAATSLAVAGLLVTAARDAHDRSVALSRAPAPLRYLPWVGAAVGIQGAVSVSGHLSAWVPETWAGPLITAVALLYALATRAPLPVRGARVVPWASFVLALVGLPTSATPRAEIAALLGLVIAVVLTARARRHPAITWTAWVAVLPLIGLSSHEAWPWFAAQPTSTELGLTLAGTGGILLVGAALIDLRGRAWTVRSTPVHRQLRAPAAVGVFGLVAGLLVAVLAMPVPHARLLTIGVGSVVVAVALVGRIGSIAGLGIVVAWGGVAPLSDPAARPWLAIGASTALLAAAAGVRRVTVDRVAWSRWDTPLLVAAAPVAATALLAPPHLAAVVDSIVGLQLVAVAIRLRRRAVLAEGLGWAGTALITVGSTHAGAGWLAASLVALSAAHTGLAVVARPRARTARQVIGALAGLGSWCAALAAVAWSTPSRVEVSALAWAALALVLVAATARTRLDRTWVIVWGTTAALVSAGATAAVLLLPGYGARWPIVAALGCLTVAAAGAATPVRASWLRDASIGGALATPVVAWEVLRVPVPERIVVLSVLAVGVSVATLLVRGNGRAWDRPLVDLGAGAATLAVLLGLGGHAGEWALVPAVAAAAVQVAAAGVLLRRLALQVLGPVLACVAWVLLMAVAGARGPQWYTAAVGLALLAVVSLWRRDRRRRREEIAAPEIVALELLGIAFLVGAPMAQALTASVGPAFVATGIGIGLGVWGAGTRVRRRVTAAVVVILSSLAVVVAVPLVRLLPAWGGAGMWIAVAVIGLVAVLGATMLERAQDAVTGTRTRLEEWTAGWE